jgi:hypothetical protein
MISVITLSGIAVSGIMHSVVMLNVIRSGIILNVIVLTVMDPIDKKYPKVLITYVDYLFPGTGLGVSLQQLHHPGVYFINILRS